MNLLAAIAESLPKGKADRVKELVAQALATGLAPEEILDGGLLRGMAGVSARWRNNEAHIPEVLIAARAMNAGLSLLRPRFAAGGDPARGRVVIGTVQGDLHDLGKNLVKTMMEARGLEVVDLGVDVSAARFARAAREEGADLLACSALLTTTMPELAGVVDALGREGLRGRVSLMVGGACVTERFARDIGADGWARDAAGAAEAAASLLAASRPPEARPGAREGGRRASRAAGLRARDPHPPSGATPCTSKSSPSPIRRTSSSATRRIR